MGGPGGFQRVVQAFQIFLVMFLGYLWRRGWVEGDHPRSAAVIFVTP